MNEIRKSFDGAPMKADAQKDIALINKYALRELSPDEVFVFNVNLCDDGIDRDLDSFSVMSLKKLQGLFIGKPLISDHSWSASNQAGRIYKTQLVRDGNVTRLRASIYMIRTENTAETIKLIEGGILREVSVSFSCKRRTCSVCGKDMRHDYLSGDVRCENGHVLGTTVDGKLVYRVLEEPADAYEVSLVAVPAQPQASITKSITGRREITPEESERRKKIFEDVNGIQITDEVWQLIMNGSVTGKAVAEQEIAKQKNGGKPLPDHPCAEDKEGSIEFAILPGINDSHTEKECLTALAFARKDLSLPPIKIKYFVPIEDLPLYGVSVHDCTVFKKGADVYGTVDMDSSDRIYVRYHDNVAFMQKVVLHECYHVKQFLGPQIGSNEIDERFAYEYMGKKAFELWHLGKDDYEDLLLKEVTDISSLS